LKYNEKGIARNKSKEKIYNGPMYKGLVSKASITINVSAAEVWEALVNPKMIKQYGCLFRLERGKSNSLERGISGEEIRRQRRDS